MTEIHFPQRSNLVKSTSRSFIASSGNSITCYCYYNYILSNNFIIWYLAFLALNDCPVSGLQPSISGHLALRLPQTNFSKGSQNVVLALQATHGAFLKQKAGEKTNKEWKSNHACHQTQGCLPPLPWLPSDIIHKLMRNFHSELRRILPLCLPCPSSENPLTQTSVTLQGIGFMTCNIKWIDPWNSWELKRKQESMYSGTAAGVSR